jgi:hypothetical protein
MPVPITCSGCSATMSAPDSFIGKRVSCPRCKTSFVIPDPKAAQDFEVVEDEEPLPVAEVLDDDPPAAPAAKPASTPVPNPVPKPVMPAATKAVAAAPLAANPMAAAIAGAAAAATTGKLKKPNPKSKKQVDPSDYRTRINGKPLAIKPGEAMPPTSLPRKSPPRK